MSLLGKIEKEINFESYLIRRLALDPYQVFMSVDRGHPQWGEDPEEGGVPQHRGAVLNHHEQSLKNAPD